MIAGLCSYIGPLLVGALLLIGLLRVLGPSTPLDKFSAEQRKKKGWWNRG